MSNLLKRTITGFWIVVIVLGGFWLHPVSFFITGLIILTGLSYEYYSMVRQAGVEPQIIPGVSACIILYILSTLCAAHILPYEWLLTIVPVIILIIVIELYRKKGKPFDSLAHTLFPLIYISLPLSLFPHAAFSRVGIRSLLPHSGIDFSPWVIVGFFILLWINDTGAYLAGVTMGKHRLLERISPKKSWEGFFGGLILSVIASLVLSEWMGVLNRAEWIIVSIIVAVAGTYGDLTESMLKRSLGVKDTGNIMPGHGGFLDRFDSTLISFPLVFLFILLFG